MSKYISFQGRVFLADRDEITGQPLNVTFVGNVPDLTLSLKTDVADHYESQSGQRTLDNRFQKTKSIEVGMTLEEFIEENITLAFHGHHLPVTSGTTSNEVISATTPTLNKRYLLAHQKVSNVVVTDSAATPATLQAGTNYTADEGYGTITFTNITGFTAPIKVAYAYGAVSNFSIFTSSLPERFLRFEGVNTSQGNKKVMFELYRVAWDPVSNFQFINNELNKMELKGSVLTDSTKPIDAELGQMGRMTYID